MNALIFDYLVVEGFSDAAVEFARETGLPHDVDHAMIQERMEIREAVEDGRIEEAVRRVNELDPEVSAVLPSFAQLEFVNFNLLVKPDLLAFGSLPYDSTYHAPRLASDMITRPCGNT